jgi:hypothetical protein
MAPSGRSTPLPDPADLELACDPRPCAPALARLAEGKTKNEIMRCVKRYIAREIYHALREPSRRTNELIA